MSEQLIAHPVALVTGASRGIGAAIAHTLAQAGMRVVGTATTDAGADRISQALAGFEAAVGPASMSMISMPLINKSMTWLKTWVACMCS